MADDHVTAVVLCLGAASRMRPLTLSLPKALLPFCGRPLLAYALEELGRHGIDHVILVTAEAEGRFEPFVRWGAQCGMHVETAGYGLQFGSAGVLRRLSLDRSLTREIQVVYGDSLLQLDLTTMMRMHRGWRHSGARVTVAYHTPEDLVVPGDAHTSYGVLTVDAAGRIVGFAEKPAVTEIHSPYASAGVFIMEADLLAERYPEGPLDLSRDVIEHLALGPESPVFGFDIAPGYRYDIGTPREWGRRQFAVLERRIVLPGVPWALVHEGPRDGAPGHLEGIALIAADCKLGDGATLRGVNILAEGVSVGRGAELRNSIVLEGSVVGAGCRLVDCVVGPRCKLGEGLTLDQDAILAEGTEIG